MVDEEAIRIVKEQYAAAMDILKANAGKLNEIAAYLLEKETKYRGIYGDFNRGKSNRKS